MTFEDQLKMLVFFHLEEHVSARHMLQVLDQDDFARENIAPEGASRKAASSRRSIVADWNNSNPYLDTFVSRHPDSAQYTC